MAVDRFGNGVPSDVLLEAGKIRQMREYWRIDGRKIGNTRLGQVLQVDRLLDDLHLHVLCQEWATVIARLDELDIILLDLELWLVIDVPRRLKGYQWTVLEPRQLVDRYVTCMRQVLPVWKKGFELRLAEASKQSVEERSVLLG